MTILAKIISNYDFKTPIAKRDIEGLANEVIFKRHAFIRSKDPYADV
jgi:hypothetical protein